MAAKKRPVGIVSNLQSLRLFGGQGPEATKLQFVGFHQLKPLQDKGVKQIIAEHYDKIRRLYFPNPDNIKYFMTEIKLYEEPLKQKKIKYSVHVRLATDFHVFSAEDAHFDVNTAVSYSLRELLRQLQKFKEKTRERWRGKGRRTEFGEYVYEAETSEGLDKKQYKPKLVRR